jgi:hypothetical protein
MVSITLTNNTITITHKTLGTWRSAAFDQVKQSAELKHKSNEYARMTMESPVTRGDNYTAYHLLTQNDLCITNELPAGEEAEED